MLPKFSWKTDVLKRNDVELLCILDLCIFDDFNNKSLLVSQSLPVKLKKINDVGNQFLTNETYDLTYNGENLIAKCLFSSLKVYKHILILNYEFKEYKDVKLVLYRYLGLEKMKKI